MSVFNGTNPNGLWSLYVIDDVSSDVGFIAGGWGMEITTVDPIADLGVGIMESSDPVGLLSNLTYSVTVSNLVNSLGQDWQLLTAAAFVSMFLPLIVFLVLQRYFVRGLLAGSVKG